MQVPRRDAVAVWLGGLLRFDPQVGFYLVMPGFAVAEVNHPALVSPFVCRLHPGETQLVGDVAADHLHNLQVEKEAKKRASHMLKEGTIYTETHKEIA